MSRSLACSPMRNYSIYIICLVILLFSFRIVYPGLIAMDDGGFQIVPYGALIRNLSVWNYYSFPGSEYYYSFFLLPYIFYTYIFSGFLPLPLWFSDASYIALMLSVGSIGIYLLVKFYLSKEFEGPLQKGWIIEISAMIPALYYSFNYYQNQFYGGEFYSSFVLISLFPLYLYAFTKYVLSAKRFFDSKNLLIMSILSVVMAGGYWQAPFLLWTVVLLLAFGAFYTFSSFGNQEKKGTKVLRVIISLSIIIIGGSWVSGAVIYSSLSAFYVHTTIFFNNKNFFMYIFDYNSSFNILIAIFSDFSYGLISTPFGYSSAHMVRASIPLTIFAGFPIYLAIGALFIKNKSKALVRYLWTILILIILISAKIIDIGAVFLSQNIVLNGLAFSFSTAYNGIPAFSGFPIILTVAVLIGYTISGVLKNAIMIVDKKYLGKRVKAKEKRVKLLKASSRHAFLSTVGVLNRPLKNHNIAKFLAIVFVLLLLLSIYPIMLDPLMELNIGQSANISAKYIPQKSMLNVANFLSTIDVTNNVLVLPITIGEASDVVNGSGYMTVDSPLSSAVGGTLLYRDRSANASWLTYPIYLFGEGIGTGNLTNYLRMLGVGFVVLDTALFNAGYSPNYTLIRNQLNPSNGFQLIMSASPYFIYKLQPPTDYIYGASSVHVMPSNFSPSDLFKLYASNTYKANHDVILKSYGQSIMNLNGSHAVVTFIKQSNDRYYVHVSSRSPFYLIADIGYSEGWHLILPRGSIDNYHYLANLYANAWLMPPGNYSCVIEFSQSLIQSFLYSISLAPLISIVVFSIIILNTPGRKDSRKIN